MSTSENTHAFVQDAAARRPVPSQLLRRLGFVLLALYLVAVAFIVLWPSHVDDNAAGGSLHSLLAIGHSAGWLPAWFTYSSVEWLSNVVMFAPGGFLLVLLLPPRVRPWVPGIAFLATCTIESIQFFMPHRTSSVLDILANTLGGTLGWFCGLLLLYLVRILKNTEK